MKKIKALTKKLQTEIAALTIPKLDGAKADLRYAIEDARLELQHQVEALKALESELNNYFIENLPMTESTGIAGEYARIQLYRKLIPRVADWDKFYAYVKRTGSFDLMHKRVSDAAVKERWEAKKDVPGVESFQTKVVSCTRI